MLLIAGAAVAMSSLGSAVGIAMMVGGRGAPLLAAWLGPDWMRAPGWAPSLLFGWVLHLLSQGAHPALVSQALARGQVVRVLRAS